MKRITTLSMCFLSMAAALTAQNFTRFDAIDGNGVKALTGLSHRTGKGLITILVPEQFDVKNVKVAAEVDADASFATLPTDFSTPQDVTILKGEGDLAVSKTWTIDFKKVKPANLPFELNFNKDNLTTSWIEGETQGWAGAQIDEKYNQVIRFSTSPVSFVVAFADAPKSIAYDVVAVGNGDFLGEFEVSAKSENGEWKVLKTFNTENKPAEGQLQELTPDIRFVRWIYTNKNAGPNVNVNNIVLTKADGLGVTQQQLSDVTAFIYEQDLVISDPDQLVQIVIYNAAGQQVRIINQPNSVETLSLQSGVYIVKMRTKDDRILLQRVSIK